MPFTSTDPMLERARLIALQHEGLYSITELAQRFGVSRPVVYKGIERRQEAEALADRSRAPTSSPQQTAPEVEALLLEARQAHPTWGRESCCPTSPIATPTCICQRPRPLVRSSNATA